MSHLQPIDGAYFTTVYFVVTTFISIVVASVGAYMTEVSHD